MSIEENISTVFLSFDKQVGSFCLLLDYRGDSVGVAIMTLSVDWNAGARITTTLKKKNVTAVTLGDRLIDMSQGDTRISFMEAAALAGCSSQTIVRAVRRGELHRQYRPRAVIDRGELIRWATRRNAKRSVPRVIPVLVTPEYAGQAIGTGDIPTGRVGSGS